MFKESQMFGHCVHTNDGQSNCFIIVFLSQIKTETFSKPMKKR